MFLPAFLIYTVIQWTVISFAFRFDLLSFQLRSIFMAVEMKFALLFALLAFTKISLGNTAGAGQVSWEFDTRKTNILCSIESVWLIEEK